jgi:hypothetical protein
VPFDELVSLHRERRGRFGELLAGLRDADLESARTGTPAPAWGEETHTVADCVDTPCCASTASTDASSSETSHRSPSGA